MAVPNNLGKCVDFWEYDLPRNLMDAIGLYGHLRPEEMEQVIPRKTMKEYKITHVLEPDGHGRHGHLGKYAVSKGRAGKIILPEQIIQMYDCPAAAEPANVEMQGGRHRRGHKGKGTRKSRKTRKARKASKRTRKH